MDYFNKLIDIYEKKLNIPLNNKCSECDSAYKEPLLPWQIGNSYSSEKGGVFIAGKPHRGTFDHIRKGGVIDGRELGEELFFNTSWPYWSYTRAILNSVYESSEESWNHIAFSNVVKCSSTNDTDNTSWSCANKCIRENQVIFKEIELLQPRKIIFFTWSMHRKLFDEIPFAQQGTIVEHTSSDYRRVCGAKQLGWWDRSLSATWGNVDFLILGHPERMKKIEYVEMVSKWLKKANN